MAYVDLNPISARISRTLASSEHTSISQRLTQCDTQGELDRYLAPLISGLERNVESTVTLANYIEYLETLIQIVQTPSLKHTRWHQWMSALKRQQRVYGATEQMAAWLTARNMQFRETVIPNN